MNQIIGCMRRFLTELKPKTLDRINLFHKRERGQALVITAVAFLAILAFAGLVTDAGSLYLNFTRLKRALDAAAVAAANNIKDSSLSVAQRNTYIREAAREMLILNDVSDINSLDVYTCEDSGLPADFASMCPASGDDPRKLVYVGATQESRVYFLQLFGIDNINITTHSVGEAATLDLVLVIDTSESMGVSTKLPAGISCPGENPGDPPLGEDDDAYVANFDPNDWNQNGCSGGPSGGCNGSNTCEPLQSTKDAAISMVDKLFDGKDRVAIVTYDFSATVHDPDGSTSTFLESDLGAVKGTINAISLNDDLGPSDLPGGVNPANGDVNPLDVNGDAFYDFSSGGQPKNFGDSLVYTCTGCGIRLAGDILKRQGRVDSVWVIVFLSDGSTNVSDLPDATDVNIKIPPPPNPAPTIGQGYTNGFCGGSTGNRMWDLPWCQDGDPTTRHCGPFHPTSAECPPGAVFVGGSTPPYDADDYAYDMTDRVALLGSENSNEPLLGEDIAIYTIGYGVAGNAPYTGEELLRYMANIGDDNFRDPPASDPCDGVAHKTSCGQYYYTDDAGNLQEIFENIAGSIFTRISQ